MNKIVLELFQCPVCHGELNYIDSMDSWIKEEKDLQCINCQKLYPVINGIPIFVELSSTGWVGVEKAYYHWQQSDKILSFKQFFELSQKYSNIAYGNYDQLIEFSHAISSNDTYNFFLHSCENPQVKEWCSTQDMIYDWVFKHVLENLNSDEIILDVGIGGATVESYISNNTNNKVISMDISCRELFLFRNKLSKEQVILTCGDFRQSPLKDNSIDVIISTGGFQHIDHFEDALNEFNRILKKGGKIVMMAFVNWPHDESLNNVYEEVGVPFDGIKLLNQFQEIGFDLVKFDENIASHPKFKQYGAVLIKR